MFLSAPYHKFYYALRKLKDWSLAHPLSFLLWIISFFAFSATFIAFNNLVPFQNNLKAMLWLLSFDILLFICLGILVFRRAYKIWREHKEGKAGSRLHLRFLTVFTSATVLPGVIIAFASTGFFYLVVQSWFSDKVKTAVEESHKIAEAYLHEHQERIRDSAIAMAQDLNAQAFYLTPGSPGFRQFIQKQVELRSLSEAIIFDRAGKIYSKAGFGYALEFNPVTEDELARAEKGEIIIWPNPNDFLAQKNKALQTDRMRALIHLDNYGPLYLYIARLVDSNVLHYLQKTDSASSHYLKVEKFRNDFQLSVTFFFVGFTFLLVGLATLYGLKFADQFVSPIKTLILASERIKSGDLSYNVPLPNRQDELSLLSQEFNQMTRQLSSQREELIEANRQVDFRRRLMEHILSGISSAVLYLDANYHIKMANHAAEIMLDQKTAHLIGKPLFQILPKLAELFNKLKKKKKQSETVEGQIHFTTAGGDYKTFHITLAEHGMDKEDKGYLITFDDLSDIMAAQRKTAWSDIARRIAHEIKNPLTPIQLAADRLERKYSAQIMEDKKIFNQCLNTIKKHVASIGRMVTEFSNFAKMPDAVMQEEDLAKLCEEAIASYKNKTGNTELHFLRDKRLKNTNILADAEQINQVLLNLIENALNAIEARPNKEEKGKIELSLKADNDFFKLSLTDNGIGLPENKINILTEPYITTREHGTGLGLAIVKKIIEDHNGTLILKNRTQQINGRIKIVGAEVEILLPRHK